MACYVGIDPSHRRGHATVALDDELKPLAVELCATPARVRALIETLPSDRKSVGIDAPRTMPTKAREWFFSTARGRWRRGDGEKGQGRHCEVAVVAVAGAKAQWSQHDGEIPGWMQLGMQLFRDLADVVDEVHEVFPTPPGRSTRKNRSSASRCPAARSRRRSSSPTSWTPGSPRAP